jgi:hypothetical protein
MFPGQDAKTTYTASDLSGTWLEDMNIKVQITKSNAQ